MARYSLFLLAVCLLVQSSYQLSCYKCTDKTKTKGLGINIPGVGWIDVPTEWCPETFDTKKDTLSTCRDNEVCVKLDHEGDDGATRLCAPTTLCDQAKDGVCHSCKTDGCNGASSMSIALFTLVVPSLIWKLC